MSQALSSSVEPRTGAERSDAELIAAVRGGDSSAYGVLYERHSGAAVRLARQLTSHGDADDLVADSFTRVLALLQDGKGPDEAFRAYLLTAIRRLHIDRIRSVTRTRPTDDEHVLDQSVPFDDAVEAAFESTTAARAFTSLPERWQLVLWHLEVEGQKPADVAPLLGMSPNSVSALAYRAREGLRQAYLSSHAADVADPECQAITPLLGGFVRQTLSARDATRVDRHLDDCRRCAGVYLELREVNQGLRGMLAPIVLGQAALGYFGAAGTGTAASGALAGASSAAAGSAAMSGGAAGAGEVLGAGTAAGGAATASVGVSAGGTLMSSAVVGQAARVAFLPVQGAAAAAASAGTPAAVAAVVTAGALATGTVVGTVQGWDADAPAQASPAETPESAMGADPQSTADPTPTPTASPTSEPTATSSPDPTLPSPTPTESDAETLQDDADEPAPPAMTPTDFSLGTPSVQNDSTLLQRRVIVPISADGGSNPTARTVTMRVTFASAVRFRGIPGDGWQCNVARGEHTSALACTATLPAGQGGTFAFKAIGLRPQGTISITAADDPVSGNNNTSFTSGTWLPL